MARADAQERPRLLSGLSAAQITGGALAAATAAALGAKLGVAGTVIGAAFASLIINVGGKIYSETLRRTQHGISGAMSRQGRLSRNAERARSDEVADRRDGTADPVLPSRGDASDPSRLERPARRRLTVIAVSALASFAIAAVLVTVVEVATGRGLDGSPSTTVGQVVGQDAREPVKPGSDQPQTAPATPAEQQEQPGGGAASQPPTSQPSAPEAPGEVAPDAQAPAGPDTDEAPNDAPSAEAPPSAAQPSAKAQPPAAEGSGP